MYEVICSGMWDDEQEEWNPWVERFKGYLIFIKPFIGGNTMMLFTIDITESDDYIKFDAVRLWCETHDIPYNMKTCDDGIHLTAAMPEMELGQMLTFIKED